MGKAFTDEQLVAALQAAEAAHPPPEKYSLSKPVSSITGYLASMRYSRQQSIQVEDPDHCAMIEGFIAAAAAAAASASLQGATS